MVLPLLVQTQPFEVFFPAVVDFVTQAVAFYSREVSTTALEKVSRAALETAMRSFDARIQQEALLLKLNFFYEAELVRFDRYRAPNVARAQAHLALAQQCVLQAAQYWQVQMAQAQAAPEQVGWATRTLIGTWFTTLVCQP
jgi:hypothetical protein